MTSEQRTCQNCKAEFTVVLEDKRILKKLEVPLPQLCSMCSFRRRLTYRSEWRLYRRNCESCGKSMLAMYAPSSYAHVYCRDCWFSDTWNAVSYARDYGPNRPFLEQFFELMREVPQYNLYKVGTNENAEYTNAVKNVKDCYLVFSSIESEGCVYGKNVDNNRDCVDCYNTYKSELVYQGMDVHESYHSAYLTRCTKCVDCYLCRDCEDCQDCFGSVNLRHKQFYWYNEPLTKEEYKKRLTEVLASREEFTKAQERFKAHSQKYPVKFAHIHNAEDASGDYLSQSTHARNSFDSYNLENASDVYRVITLKDSFRCSHITIGELLYENTAGPGKFSCVATVLCQDSNYAYYSYSCLDCENILGCVGLRKKKFCILNKQYTEKEYTKLRAQIVESMKQKGEWGEFFETKDSPHAFNDTLADEILPLTKEEVLKQGWRWNEDQGGTRGKETITPKNIPSTIESVHDTIIKEILMCSNCGMNYRIEGNELKVLRSLNLPLPLECHICRFKARLNRHNFPPLHHRVCMCTNSGHTDHEKSSASCGRELETTYAPDRPELVYCQECYNAEVI